MADKGHLAGVRITNEKIYALLLDTHNRVQAVEQTVRETLKPGLDQHTTQIESLRENKADRADLMLHAARLAAIEMRVYAIISGLVAAIIGAKGVGLL